MVLVGAADSQVRSAILDKVGLGAADAVVLMIAWEPKEMDSRQSQIQEVAVVVLVQSGVGLGLVGMERMGKYL